MENVKGRYTMVWINALNELSVSHINIDKLELKKYAQFPNALIMQYKEKGGRKLKAIRYAENDDLKVFINGWVSDIKSTSDAQKMACVTYYGGYKGFDPNY